VSNQHKSIIFSIGTGLFLFVQYLFIGDILEAADGKYPLVYELFAAVVGSIITVIAMALIMRNQIDQEKNKEFASSIFERKLSIYQDLLEIVFSIDDDKIIEDAEIHALENQIGIACLVADKKLVSILSQYIYQLKVYGVLYFRSLNDVQLAEFSKFAESEKKHVNADASKLCDQKYNQTVPVKGNEIMYFLSLDECIQGLREDLALIEGDVAHHIEHFVRTPINPKQIHANPNRIDDV